MSEPVEFDFDLDISEPSVEESTGILPEASNDSDGPEVDTNGNPVWGAVLNEIPREFHPKVAEQLKTWDAGVKAEFEKRAQALQEYQAQFEPWNKFQEQGIAPTQLEQAYAIMNRLNNDPQGFYAQMTELMRQRGLLAQEQQKQQQQQDELIFDDEQEQQPQQPQDDPRVAMLQQQLQQLVEYQQMREQATQKAYAEAQMDARIHQDMTNLEAKTGKLPDYVRDEVINRAMLMTEREQREVSFEEAYMDVQRLRQQMLSTPRPGQLAPRVVPGGGGYPAAAHNPDALKTPEGRGEAIQAIIERMRN